MNANKANTLTISGIRTTAGHFLVNVNGSFFFFVTGLTGKFLGKSSQKQWAEIKGEQKLEKMPDRIKIAVKEIYKQILGLQASTSKGYGEIFEMLSPTAERKQIMYVQEAVKAEGTIILEAPARIIPKIQGVEKKVKAKKEQRQAEVIPVVVPENVGLKILGKMELPTGKRLGSKNSLVVKNQEAEKQAKVATEVKTEVKTEIKHQPVAVKKIEEKPVVKTASDLKKVLNKKSDNKGSKKKAYAILGKPADEEEKKIIEKLNSQSKGTLADLCPGLANLFNTQPTAVAA